MKLKSISEKKTEAVKQLKSEMAEMKGQTEEQLHAILAQVTTLAGQVRDQLR